MNQDDIWFKFYPSRYRADTLELSLAEDGLYRRLIDYYIEIGRPLPNSPRALARIAGVSHDEFAELFQINLDEKFVVSDCGKFLHLKLCDEIINERNQKFDKLKKMATKGGEARSNKYKEKRASVQNVPQGIKISDKIVPQGTKKQGENVLDRDRDIDNISSLHSDILATPKKLSKEKEGMKYNEWLKSSGNVTEDGGILLPSEFEQYAKRKFQWDERIIDFIYAGFFRYWTGPDAKRPNKRDWLRAWQNWCDSSIGQAKAFIRDSQGIAGGKGQGYAGKVADSSESAKSILEAGEQYAYENDDMPKFDS